MWKPWIGNSYLARRTLILGESCYDWDSLGVTYQPQPNHPCVVVRHAIENLRDASTTMRKLTRAICGASNPEPNQAAEAWNRFAFTNYIPVSVGYGAMNRPSAEAWGAAAKEWPALLKELRPRTVIVLGKEMWRRMPETQTQISGDVQGYALTDGTIAMCFAIPHPSRGPTWNKYSFLIAQAENDLDPALSADSTALITSADL
jgi:hypothetical protein